MFHQLSTRFALGFLALVVSVFLVLGIYLASYLQEFEENRLIDRLTSEARLVGELARPTFVQPDAGESRALADRLAADIGSRVTLIAVDGNVYGDSEADPAQMENHAGRPEVVRALAEGFGTAKRHSATLDQDILYVAIPVRNDGETVGIARVALPIERAKSLIGDLMRTLVAVLLIAAFVTAILATLMARAFTRPLAELVAVTQQVTRGDLSARANTRAGAEYAELADAFNEMAGELQRTIQTIDLERSRLATLVEHLADGIVFVGHNGEVTLVNQAAERLLNVPRERAMRRGYAEVLRDYELRAVIDAARGMSAADRRPVERFIDLGRPPRSVQAFALAIPAERVANVLLVLRDITELRRTEAVRRDFVANVSHDLRTPIASLKALTETLLDGALDDEAVAREFLGRMQVEVDDLAKLVEALLELSRAEAGQLELRRADEDVAALARRAAARLEAQAALKAISLRLDLPEQPATAFCDRDRIEQVFVNLLHNAVKFTPAGGTVTIVVAADADWTTVTVRDTGPGLDEADLDRVFERFYKTDRARAQDGSGLGLAIAKHLVQLHGGRIWAESRPGQGATFSFRLPRRQPAETAARGGAP